jgi:catechol 2,3-dioxygenase-like lactoylglutathione lyase family enzyme
MPKIRHIAYRAEDVEAMASFFAQAFEMEIVQRRQNGAIDLSDGSINITLLRADGPRPDGRQTRPGVEHIGFTVEDEAQARERIEAAGGKEMNTINLGSAHYEVKFEGPEGIVVDLGHWAGAEPIDEAAREVARS